MSQRSHYVPEFYLNNFVTPGEKTLWVFDKKSRQFRNQLPKDTAVIKDYYLSSEERKEGQDSIVEAWFSQMEGDASIAINKWITTPIALNKEDIQKVLPFVAFLHSRVPREMEVTRQILQVGLDEAIEKIKQDAADLEKVKKRYEKFCRDTGNQNNVSFEEFLKINKDPTLGSQYLISITEDAVKGHSFGKVDIIDKYLSNMNWALLLTMDEDYFMTNDCPLNIFCLDIDGMAIFGGGIGLPNVEITLPLSPLVCLRIDKKSGTNTKTIDARYVREINRRICHMADSYVFSAYKNNTLTKIMLEFADSHKLPKIDIASLKEMFKKAFHKGDN